MKLRINNNSIRLRLLRSEVKSFWEDGVVEHAIHFAQDDNAFLTYRLEHAPLPEVEVQYRQSQIVVALPRHQAEAWVKTHQVGIYATVNLGKHGSLNIIVEKDFACLDLSDADNVDTFPNPSSSNAC